MGLLCNIIRKGITSSIAVQSIRRLQTSPSLFAGHAKWQNIKHIKAAKDSQRSLMVAKQMRIIRMAITEGGGSVDPKKNNTLKNAIDEAIRRGVTMSTIKITLKKSSENVDTSKLHRHLFEGRLYNKLFIIIAVYTDNLALTRNQIAVPFKKHRLEANNTKHCFEERGLISAIARPDINTEQFDEECLNDAVECGAEDVEIYDVAERQVTFICDANDIVSVKQKLTKAGHKIAAAECVFEPKVPTVSLSAAELENYESFKQKLETLVEGFDEIYDNLESDENEN